MRCPCGAEIETGARTKVERSTPSGAGRGGSLTFRRDGDTAGATIKHAEPSVRVLVAPLAGSELILARRRMNLSTSVLRSVKGRVEVMHESLSGRAAICCRFGELSGSGDEWRRLRAPGNSFCHRKPVA